MFVWFSLALRESPQAYVRLNLIKFQIDFREKRWLLTWTLYLLFFLSQWVIGSDALGLQNSYFLHFTVLSVVVVGRELIKYLEPLLVHWTPSWPDSHSLKILSSWAAEIKLIPKLLIEVRGRDTQPSIDYLVCLVTQLCPTVCDPLDCSPPGSSVHWVFLVTASRILEFAEEIR